MKISDFISEMLILQLSITFCNVNTLPFRLIWFINQSLTQSSFVCRWHHCRQCTPLPATGLDIDTLYLIQIGTLHMHIKYIVIISFYMTAILVLFFDCYPAHLGSHRDFISHILMYLFTSIVGNLLDYWYEY